MVDDVRRCALFFPSASTPTSPSSTSTSAPTPAGTSCRGALRLAHLPSRPRRTRRRRARANLVGPLARAAIGAPALRHLVVDAFGGLAAHAGGADWSQAVAFDLPCATVRGSGSRACVFQGRGAVGREEGSVCMRWERGGRADAPSTAREIDPVLLLASFRLS